MKDTHSHYILTSLNQCIAEPLLSLYVINPHPANNPELLCIKFYSLPGCSRGRGLPLSCTLLAPSHEGSATLSSTLLRHGLSPLLLQAWWGSSFLSLSLSPKPGTFLSPVSVCPAQPMTDCFIIYQTE